MNHSPREKWLLTAMPTAMVLLAYSFWFYRPKQNEINQLRENLASARQEAVSENELQAAQTRLQLAQQKRRKMTEQIRWHDQSARELVQSLGRNRERFRVVERIEELLLKNNVVLLAQAPVERQPLSQQHLGFLADLRKWAGHSELEYRQLKMAGSYGDVKTVLEELAQSDSLVLPLSLRAHKSQQQQGLEWELVLVM
ncbi:MAG: hypothetical protein MI861_10095 [Pirellulales bacterium]|nr:hypothetical protein [Pirellulales bacterium]